ncbi:hypothetical protein RKLH11_3306 [Rhodobacteraceae bacterium KLH11]|nr:hypothetical protein RKLH11_3306 [Rhodobacteraceae bacterium KLH11]
MAASSLLAEIGAMAVADDTETRERPSASITAAGQAGCPKGVNVINAGLPGQNFLRCQFSLALMASASDRAICSGTVP